MTTAFRYGFRIVGDCRNERRLIDWGAAFVAYCQSDDRADVNQEAYLSAFAFGNDFRRHLETTDSTKGFVGYCCSSWLWFDIDRESDLDAAATDTRRLAASLVDRYRIDGDDLLLFFSGSKGFHVGLPLSLCRSPAPSLTFHTTCRRLVERIGELTGIKIDLSVYDRVRAFRAPNSRHPKTRLHKRRLTFDELLNLRTDVILRLAADPAPFDLPTPPPANNQAIADWREASEVVDQAGASHRERSKDSATLNRGTLDFIRDGAGAGDRHRLLFSAAANLAEFGCSPQLAYALLTDAAFDSGLSPAEIRRQIDCGLQHDKTKTEIPNRD